jgi:hypothetical protein
MITKHLKFLFSSLTFVFLAMLTLVGMSARKADAQGGPLLWLSPASSGVIPGDSTEVVVQLDGISNVYGAELHLTFDPAVLAVVDADGSQSGVQISAGSCPAPGFTVTNSADNSAGAIDYALTQLNPQPPCDGGDLATIEFQCLVSDANSDIVITSSIISDPSGSPMNHTVQNGTIECLSNVFSIEGTVVLQSWADPSGTAVILQDEHGNVLEGPVAVGGEGSFRFVAQIGASYSVTASRQGYLSTTSGAVSGAVGEVIDLGLTVLPAGDVNGDQVVNILDITAVAGNFGKSSPIAWGE